MENHYSLRIFCDSQKKNDVDKIIGVEGNYNIFGWGIQVIEYENDEYFHFIDYFVNLLNGKFELLEELGIQRNDITIWFIYEYRHQCNLEFLPDDMKLLGLNKIKLCITCVETGQYL